MTETSLTYSVRQGAGTESYDQHVEDFKRMANIVRQHPGLAVVWSDEQHAFVMRAVSAA